MPRNFPKLGLAAFLALPLAACMAAPSGESKVPSLPIQVSTVTKGLEHPWGMAFLPDGHILVTERAGRLRLVGKDGRLSSPISGVPAVHARGQGGLLDVALDPAFASNQRIYLSYAEPGAQSQSGTAVARARLDIAKLSLTDVQVIFRQQPKTTGNGHYGSRLAFGRDGSLFVTLGERQQFTPAQDLAKHYGKVVRINTDGSVPTNNPFRSQSGAQPEIWSLGHRNPQGAALHPETGELWISEHGARGGDEINIARAGKNYGWPVIAYGVNYSGTRIGEGTSKAGVEQPLHYWDPSIAPGNIAFYTGDKLPAWRGSLFVTALKDQSLYRLSLDGNRVTGQEKLLPDIGKRLRDVRQGPDGWLYLLTDEDDGEILRVTGR